MGYGCAFGAGEAIQAGEDQLREFVFGCQLIFSGETAVPAEIDRTLVFATLKDLENYYTKGETLSPETRVLLGDVNTLTRRSWHCTGWRGPSWRCRRRWSRRTGGTGHTTWTGRSAITGGVGVATYYRWEKSHIEYAAASTEISGAVRESGNYDPSKSHCGYVWHSDSITVTADKITLNNPARTNLSANVYGTAVGGYCMCTPSALLPRLVLIMCTNHPGR